MNSVEKRLEAEKRYEELHQAALNVCGYLMDGVSLTDALRKGSITSRNFFEQKRLHADVKKAYMDAEEVRAELKMAQLDDLSDEFLATSPELDKDTYKAVTDTIKWSITKLLPEKYGTRPNIEAAQLTQNNINIMSSLSDEQLMALINGAAEQTKSSFPPSAAPAVTEKKVDNIIEADYTETDDSGKVVHPRDNLADIKALGAAAVATTESTATAASTEVLHCFNQDDRTGFGQPECLPPNSSSTDKHKSQEKSKNPENTTASKHTDTPSTLYTPQSGQFDLSAFAGIK